MTSLSDEGSAPDESWTNADIQNYLDQHNLAYKTSDTKAQLLAHVKAGD
ncbi:MULTISPECIES: hypothetical protein [Lactobacillaceae]